MPVYRAVEEYKKMLLVGGDSGRAGKTQIPVYTGMGFEVTHWDSEKVRKNEFPQGTQVVVVMTDLLSHSTSQKAAEVGKAAGIPVIQATRRMAWAHQVLEEKGIIVKISEEGDLMTTPTPAKMPDLYSNTPVTLEHITRAKAAARHKEISIEAVEAIGRWLVQLEAGMSPKIDPIVAQWLRPLTAMEAFLGRCFATIPEGWVIHVETAMRAYSLIHSRSVPSEYDVAWSYNLAREIRPDAIFFQSNHGTVRMKPPVQRSILASENFIATLGKDKAARLRAWFRKAAQDYAYEPLPLDLQGIVMPWEGKPTDFMVGMLRIMMATDQQPESPQAFARAYQYLFKKGVDTRYPAETARLMDADYLVVSAEQKKEAPPLPLPTPTQVAAMEAQISAPALAPVQVAPQDLVSGAKSEPLLGPTTETSTASILGQIEMLASDVCKLTEEVQATKAGAEGLQATLTTLTGTIGKIEEKASVMDTLTVDTRLASLEEERALAKQSRSEVLGKLHSLSGRVEGLAENRRRSVEEIQSKITSLETEISRMDKRIDVEGEVQQIVDRVAPILQKILNDAKIDDRFESLEIEHALTRRETIRLASSLEAIEARLGEIAQRVENMATTMQASYNDLERRIAERPIMEQTTAMVPSAPLPPVVIPERLVKEVIVDLILSGRLPIRVG